MHLASPVLESRGVGAPVFDAENALRALLAFLDREMGLRDLEPDEPIFSSGLIDSFGLVRIAAFISTTLEAEIPTRELTVAKMDRPRQMIEAAARYARKT